MTKKNDSNYMSKIEKWIKRSMKKKISISSKVIVAFMITGVFLQLGTEIEAIGEKWVYVKDGSVLVQGSTITTDNSIVLNPGSYPNNRDTEYQTSASGESSASNQVLIGSNAKAEKGNVDPTEAIVIGNLARAKGGQAISIGAHSWAKDQAVALGANVYALDTSSIAIGSDDNPNFTDSITAYDYKNYFKDLYEKLDPKGTYYGFLTGTTEKNDNTPEELKKQRIYSPTVANGVGAMALGSRSIAYKDGATALGTLAFALGKGSTSLGTLSRAEGEGSIALGNKTKVFASNSVGTGNEIQVLQKGGMAYGYKAYSGGEGSIAIGHIVYSNTEIKNLQDIEKIKDGERIDSVEPLLEVKNQIDDVVSSNKKNNAIVIGGQSLAYGDNSIALGKKAFSLGDNSFAVGSYSYTDKGALNAIALGTSAKALASNSMSVGVGTEINSDGEKSIVIGTNSKIKGNNSALLGTDSTIDGNNILAIGTESSIKGLSNLSFGNKINVLDNSSDNIALGNNINVAKNTSSSLVIGNLSRIGNTNDENIQNATAIGYNAKVVQGTGTKETGNNSMALGKGAIATLENSVALGVESKTDYSYEQLDRPAWVSKGAIAIPTSGKTGVISVGAKGRERRIVNVASGSFDTDAANVGQLKTVEDRLEMELRNLTEGGGVQYLSVEKSNPNGQAGEISLKIEQDENYTRYVQLKKEALYIEARQKLNDENFNESNVKELVNKVNSLGVLYKNTSEGSIADKAKFFNGISEEISNAQKLNGIERKNKFEEIMGQITKAAEDASKTSYNGLTEQEIAKLKTDNNYLNDGAKGIDSIAFGFKAKTSGNNNGEDGKNSVAIGFNSTVNSQSSIGIGTNVAVLPNSQNSIAIGNNATIQSQANNSILIGNEGKIAQNMANSIGIGNNVKVNNANSVALGNGAVTKDATTEAAVNINGIKYGEFAGKSVGVVSIGDKDNERTLVNVAPGAISESSTDAINGSQLYATNNVLSTLAKSTQNVLGSSFKLSDSGEISVENNDVGGTGKKTLEEAIAAVNERKIGLSDGTNRLEKNISDNPIFTIKGNEDIVTSVSNEKEMILNLNKGNVVKGDTKVVSGDTVFNAIKNAKTNVVASSNQDILKVTKAGSDEDISKNLFTIDIDKDALKNTVEKDFVTKENYKSAVDINPEVWKQKLGVEDISLRYKTTEDKEPKSVSLKNGLVFSGDENIKITSDDGGLLSYNLNKDLSGIHTISNGNTKITIGDNGNINVNQGKIVNLGSGNIAENSTDAITGKDVFKYLQSYASKNEVLNNDNAYINFKGNSGEKKLNLSKEHDFEIAVEDVKTTSKESNLTTVIAGNKLAIKNSKTPRFEELYVNGVSITTNVPDDVNNLDGVTKKPVPGLIYGNGYKIANIAAGEVEPGSKAAVNGGQLYTVDEKVNENQKLIKNNQETINNYQTKLETVEKSSEEQKNILAKGWNIKSNSTTSNIKLGDTFTINGDSNIITNLQDQVLNISMNKNPEFSSVKVGNVNIENNKISGLKPGNNSTDAVAYSQLKPALDALDLKIDEQGNVSAGKYLNEDNINKALNKLENSKIVFADNNSSVDVKFGEKVTFNSKDNNILVNLDPKTKTYSMSMADSPIFKGKVTANGINVNGKPIEGVGDAVEDDQAINFKQYKLLESQIHNNKVSNVALSTNSPLVYTLDGDIVIKKGENSFYKLKDLNEDGTVGKAEEIETKKLQDIKISAIGIDKQNSPLLINNVRKGKISENSTDAVNGSQISKILSVLGMTTDSTNNIELPEYRVGTNEKYNNLTKVFADGAKGVYGNSSLVYENDGHTENVVYAYKIKDGKESYDYYYAKDVGDNLQVNSASNPVEKEKLKINLKQIDNKNVRLGHIAPGENDDDAVNVSQLKQVEEHIAKNEGQLSGITNNIFKLKANNTEKDMQIVKAGEKIDFVSSDDNIVLSLKKDSNDEHKIDFNLNSKLAIGKTNKITVDGENGVIDGLKNTTWNKDTSSESNKAATEGQLKQVEDNINNNFVKYDDNENKITLQKGNSSDILITNLAPGNISSQSKDAVNGSQLNQVQLALTNNNSDGNDIKFDVTMNDNNNFNEIKVNNVKTAIETLVKGWRVASGDAKYTTNTEDGKSNLELDSISGATNIVQGQTLVVVGDGKNITTKAGSKNVTNVKVTDDKTFTGKMGVLEVKMSEEPTFNDVIINGKGSVATKKDISELDDKVVKYDDETKAVISLGGNSGTTLENVNAGHKDKDAVNISQIKQLISSDITYKDNSWDGLEFEKVNMNNTTDHKPTTIVDAIKENTRAINKGFVFKGNLGDNLDNSQLKPQYLGSKLEIIASSINDGSTNYLGNNLKTQYSLKDGILKIGLNENPLFASINLGKDDNKIKIVPVKSETGTTILKLSDNDNKNVVLNGLKEGNSPDSAVTKGEVDKLKEKLGLNKETIGVGKDGLDGKSIIEKVESLRDGLSGTMVYTDKAGRRVTKEGDKYYTADKEEISGNDVQISAVNGSGDVTSPVALNNVKSALGFEDKLTKPLDEATSKAKVKELLTKDKDLNRVSTAKDLQGVAKAGLDFKGNDGTVHKNLGETLSIEGSSNSKYSDSYSSENLTTHLDNGTLRIAMLKTPKFEGIKLGNKGTEITATDEGKIEVTTGSQKDTLATEKDVNSLKDKIGLPGKDGKPGKDGTLVDSIEKLKTGISGTMVYTDKDGRRVTKEGDKYYTADKEEISGNDVQISAVNGSGDVTSPVALNNVKSALGFEDKLTKPLDEATSKAKVKELLTKDKDLNRVSTAKDLQGVAKAGLDFKGNDGTVHKNLGETLSIEGSSNSKYSDSYSSENLTTHLDNGTLRIAMLKTPKFENVTLGKGNMQTVITVDESDGKVGIKDKDGKVDKFVTEKTMSEKLRKSGFKLKVNNKEVEVKPGDTFELKHTTEDILLVEPTTKPSEVNNGNMAREREGLDPTNAANTHQVGIGLADTINFKNVNAENINADKVKANKVETKEVTTEKIIVKGTNNNQVVIDGNKGKVEANEITDGTVSIKNGEISGVKDVALDKTGHIVEEDQNKAVNGKTLNTTIDNLRAENAQLREGVQGTINQTNQRVTRLETKVKKGLANAAAMSGINFMEIGVNQATVGAAVGGYEGTQAVAVGVQAAPTQDVRVNAKVSLTPGSHSSLMYSIGASWRFDLR